jgi:hypothetical protein
LAEELTPFDVKCDILAELWVTYKNDEQYEDFMSYNDLGLPLAYVLSTGIVKETTKAKGFVEETFDVLLEAMGIKDEGFTCLEDIILLQQ